MKPHNLSSYRYQGLYRQHMELYNLCTQIAKFQYRYWLGMRLHTYYCTCKGNFHLSNKNHKWFHLNKLGTLYHRQCINSQNQQRILRDKLKHIGYCTGTLKQLMEGYSKKCKQQADLSHKYCKDHCIISQVPYQYQLNR